MYFTEDVMPPIITHEIFEIFQKMHKNVQLATGHNKGAEYTFSGKIKFLPHIVDYFYKKCYNVYSVLFQYFLCNL